MINKKMMKKMNILVIVSLMVVLLISFVSAFSVAFDSSKLQMYPGEVFESTFSLQNYGNANDITVELTVEEGGSYIELPEGLQYNVKPEASYDLPVKFTVPADANFGDSSSVKILFKVVSGAVGAGGGDGMVGFVINRRRTIEIEVVPKPGEETPQGISTIWIIVGIIAIVILIIIIWMAVKKKKPAAAAKPVKK